MSDVLHFIFRDFWTWLGTVILLATLTQVRLFTIEKTINNNNDSPQPTRIEGEDE